MEAVVTVVTVVTVGAAVMEEDANHEECYDGTCLMFYSEYPPRNHFFDEDMVIT